MGVWHMAKIRVRPETNTLYLDFSLRGKHCREQTALQDTPANRRTLETFANRIKREMAKGTFQYREFFPDSPRAVQFEDSAAIPPPVGLGSQANLATGKILSTPTLGEFSET